MLLIVTAAGILGSIVLGIRGLAAGSSGELDRILAIGCFLAAVAGALGSWIDDGKHSKSAPVLTRDEQVQLLVATPLVLLMLGVFLVTLIPSIYVMLPVFVVWHYSSRLQPARPPPSQAPSPAYAH